MKNFNNSKIYLLGFFFLFVGQSFAKEIVYLSRGPRSLLMGDAFTAISDDAFSLYYNPAGLAFNNGVAIDPINPFFGLTNAYADLDKFTSFPTGAAEIAETITGFPIFLEAGIAPSIKIASFGFSFLAHSMTSLMLRNATNPAFEIEYRNDTGFVLGQAISFGSGAKKKAKGSKGMTAGQRVSIGLSFKYLKREGLSSSFDLYGPKLTSLLSSGGITGPSDLREAFGFSVGTGVGADAGLMYVYSTGPSRLSYGLSVLDIMDTKFKKTQGEGEVPVQSMVVNSGIAWSQNYLLFDYTLSLDFHPINMGIDFARTVHFGAKIGVPFISVMAGYNEGYPSYGAELKLWPLKLMAGVYGVELGQRYREKQGKRAFIYISLFDVDLAAF